jgi:hypothetical protein
MFIFLLPISWQTSNVNIQDFSFASGGVCKSFLGCVPYQNIMIAITSTSTSVSASASIPQSQSGKFVSILHYPKYFKSYFNFIFSTILTSSSLIFVIRSIVISQLQIKFSFDFDFNKCDWRNF